MAQRRAPLGIRLAINKERQDATLTAAKGSPILCGETDEGGTDLNCPKCDHIITKAMPDGYHIDVTLKCPGCGGLLRLVY